MTYCLEEGLAKLKSIKAYEIKHQTNPTSLTKEDKDNYKHNKSICRANL
jgi:molybdopterin-guanine dinucleotide biosynthesis protein